MKILVCSDGHPQAERAARFVCGTAVSCGAPVTLLGIVEHPSDESALTNSLRRTAESLRSHGVAVEMVTRQGHPIPEIKRRTTEEHYDLVVIGAERKFSGPFALSAKAYHIIKEVDPPVLVVIGERTELKRVLICSGGGAYIERAVQLTGEIACKQQLQVAILHVLAEPPAIFSDLSDREENARRLIASNTALGRSLRSELAALAATNVQAEIKLRHGLVAREIVQEAVEGSYDLIVAGTAPAGRVIRTYVMGNVTSEIVNSAPCPVLVVRGKPKARPGGIFSGLKSLFGIPD